MAAGLPDSELNSIAKEAGASNVNSCITDGQFKDWVTQQTQDVTQSGVNSTPTVRLNGQDLQLTTPEDLKARVEQALAG
ncbi:DsbA family protein [Gordonia sp. SL306]|uniref:DsbA family protein n=1 Tax=Gordonia sp. SL306 TaxID=2995145 RepID=UPI0022706E9E|nr:thioredoxin domain-containing protein [Gordonia sp. SL306]WAC54417.1 thioredoxin domain-containing protein [Gordonia sp. SL306]